MFEVSKYNAYELRNTIIDDAYAVRNEACKRQNDMAKKVAAMKKKLAKMEAEMKEMEVIYDAACSEIAK